MSNHDLPRQGSRAAKCVAMLQQLGGTATVDELRNLVDRKDSLHDFEDKVVTRVRVAGLARVEFDKVTITINGQRYLGIVPEQDKYVGIPAAPRVGGGFRPLRSRSPMVVRPGAFDYRDHPSVMGGVEVPFKSTAKKATA